MDRNEMKEMEKRVDQILEKYPESRDNDHVLIGEIWREDLQIIYGTKRDYINLADLNNVKLTRFATVERARRTIQNEYHRWESSEQCANRKQELEKEYPPALGYSGPVNCFGQPVIPKSPVIEKPKEPQLF